MRMRTATLRCAVLAVVVLAVGFLLTHAAASQDADTLRMYIAHVEDYPGALVEIPITIELDIDSLDGFLISLALSRNDIAYFEVDTVVVGDDTSFVCAYDTTGCLPKDWEHMEARSTAGLGLDLRVSGISDVGSGLVPGIARFSTGTLVKIFARIRPDVPDTLTDRMVNLNIHQMITNYSNENGVTISPVLNFDGSITVLQGTKGDVNCDGNINPTDAVYIVNFVYKNWNILCNYSLGDLNCDDDVNPIDVVYLINYVYKNWPIPPCQ
jgi:hypothetical protein